MSGTAKATSAALTRRPAAAKAITRSTPSCRNRRD